MLQQPEQRDFRAAQGRGVVQVQHARTAPGRDYSGDASRSPARAVDGVIVRDESSAVTWRA